MTNPSTFDDPLKRARELKASIIDNVAILQSAPFSSDEGTTTTSIEDTVIRALRGEGRAWADITAHLNERRLTNKEAATWTEARVYSRFILINSVVATPAREVGFEPLDYTYLRNAGSGREGSSKAGKKRVKDFHNATELSANIRKPAVVEFAGERKAEPKPVVSARSKGKGRAKAKAKGRGKDEDRRKGESVEETVTIDERMVELLMRAVAKVERNFWVFVADEVEREAGKYVEPQELEKVFHDI